MASLRENWFRLVIDIKSSVIPAIWMQVVISMVFSLFVTLAYFKGVAVDQPILAGLIPSVVIGLLLVFRTNTAYDRFWEGRKLWNTITDTGRNLARNIWVMIPETSSNTLGNKIAHMRLINALTMAIKLKLRQEKDIQELKPFLTEEQYLELKTVNNIPQRILNWLAIYFHDSYKDDELNNRLFIELNNGITQILNTLGSCERIMNTPLPNPYSIHLKHLLVLYCFALPFQLVAKLYWWTIPAVGIISFSLLGIEEIGVEIENPFGYDPNDLPLDRYCHELKDDIEELIVLKE